MEKTDLYQGLISATSEAEAETILDELTKARLIAGGLITEGKSRYWWNNEVVEKIYFNISIFTRTELTKKIIGMVEEIHSDETPIISFSDIRAANPKFVEWVKNNTVGTT